MSFGPNMQGRMKFMIRMKNNIGNPAKKNDIGEAMFPPSLKFFARLSSKKAASSP